MRALILIAAVLAMSSMPTTAHSQTAICLPRAVIIERLENGYEERVIFRGIANNGVLEVLVNPVTETWSVLATFPNLGTCMWASGKGFEITDPVAPPVGDGT